MTWRAISWGILSALIPSMTSIYFVYFQKPLNPQSTYPSLAHIRVEVLLMVPTSLVWAVTVSWYVMVRYWKMATSVMREKSLMMWRRNVWIIRPHVRPRLSRHVIHPWRWQRYLPGELSCQRLWHLTGHLKVWARGKVLTRNFCLHKWHQSIKDLIIIAII